MNPDEVQLLIARVREQAQGLRRRRMRKRIWCGAAIAITFAVIGVLHFDFAGVVGPVVNGFVGLIVASVAISQSHKSDLNALAELEDPAAIGLLAETLRYEDRDVRKISEQALIKLLSLPDGLHDVDLTPAQIKSLHRELTMPNAETRCLLMQAIIRALPFIGNEESLRPVQIVAATETWSPYSRLVQQTARQTLPLLEKHIEELKAAASLLRPVETQPNNSYILLRPALGAPETPEDTLLRPVESQ